MTSFMSSTPTPTPIATQSSVALDSTPTFSASSSSELTTTTATTTTSAAMHLATASGHRNQSADEPTISLSPFTHDTVTTTSVYHLYSIESSSEYSTTAASSLTPTSPVYYVGHVNVGNVTSSYIPDSTTTELNATAANWCNREGGLCLRHVPPLSASEIVQIVTLSILFLLSLTGNSLALLKITRNPGQLRHSIYQLMLQLIVADLFVTFFCLFGDAIHKITVNWYANDAMCKLYKLLGSFAQFLSSYIVALVAVNRAMVVIKPMLSPSKMKRIMQYLIAAVWTFSLLMSIPQVIIWSKVRGPFIEEFYDCTTIAHDWTDVEAMLHACVISSFIFIVPLIIMAVSYILVIRTLAKTTTDQISDVPRALFTSTLVVPGTTAGTGKSGNSHAGPANHAISNNYAARSTFYSRAKLRSQRMSLQISIWYTACWLPYIVVFIAMAIEKNEAVLQEMSRWCIFFGQTNSIINPIIYASFHISKHEAAKRGVNRAMLVKTLNPSASHDCFRSSASNDNVNGYTPMKNTGARHHDLELSGMAQEETQIELENVTS